MWFVRPETTSVCPERVPSGTRTKFVQFLKRAVRPKSFITDNRKTKIGENSIFRYFEIFGIFVFFNFLIVLVFSFQIITNLNEIQNSDEKKAKNTQNDWI